MKKEKISIALTGSDLPALTNTQVVSPIDQAKALIVISKKNLDVYNAWQAVQMLQKELKKNNELKEIFFLAFLNLLQVFSAHVKQLDGRLDFDVEKKYEEDIARYTKILLSYTPEIITGYTDKPLVGQRHDDVILEFYVARGFFTEDVREEIVSFLETYDCSPDVHQKAVTLLYGKSKQHLGFKVYEQLIFELEDNGSPPPDGEYPELMVLKEIAHSALFFGTPKAYAFNVINVKLFAFLMKSQQVFNISQNTVLRDVLKTGQHGRVVGDAKYKTETSQLVQRCLSDEISEEECVKLFIAEAHSLKKRKNKE
jgi:hypothetical protein